MKLLEKYYWLILIIVITFLAYGQTLQMYFWQDDSALIFKLQHLSEPAGSFGQGLWIRGPYRYLVVPFVPFYKIFGMEPFGYFLIGLLTYLAAAFMFCIFAKEALGNFKLSLVCTLVFAAGFIGSDTMFRIINSWQTNIGIILVLLIFWSIAKYHNNHKLRFYFLRLLLYGLSVELVFIRSHSLIFPIIVLDTFLTANFFSFKNLVKIFLRQIPFLIIFKIWYLDVQNFGTPALANLFKQIVAGNLSVLLPLISNTGNALIPNTLQAKFIVFFTKVFLGRESLASQIFWITVISTLILILGISYIGYKYKIKKEYLLATIFSFVISFLITTYFLNQNIYWFKEPQVVLAELIGFNSFIVTLFLVLFLWNKDKNIKIYLLLGWIIIISQIASYYIQYPFTTFLSTHRYFSYSFIGYCLLIGITGYKLAEKIKFKKLKYLNRYSYLIFIVPVITINLSLSLVYQKKIITKRSEPTRKFYQDLKRYVPKIKPGAIFYFNVAEDKFSQQQFTDFFSVGSMPESTALAIYYDVDRNEIFRFTDFRELINYYNKQPKVDLDSLYSFSYTNKELVNTTSNLIKNLSQKMPSQKINININNNSLLVSDNNPFIVLKNISINSTIPQRLEISMKINLPTLPVFPYHQSLDSRCIETNQMKHYINYLRSRFEYYKTVLAKSDSEWQNRFTSNLTDNNPETIWQGNRVLWGERNKETIILDLKGVHKISLVIWQNWVQDLTPTVYSIDTSIDGINWENARYVEGFNGRKGGEYVLNDFIARQAKFVRMVIIKTLMGDAPALAGLEVVNTEFADIENNSLNEFLDHPFECVKDYEQWKLVASNLDLLGHIDLVLSNKSGSSLRRYEFPIIIGDYNYLLDLFPQGINFSAIFITSNIPAKIKLDNIELQNLILKEILQKSVS